MSDIEIVKTEREVVTITDDIQEQFLENLEKFGGNYAKACEGLGVSYSGLKHCKDKDEEFSERWDAAVEIALDLLEGEVFHRAMVGDDIPKFHKGRQTHTVREVSDTLAMFLLKSKRKEIYGDSRHIQLEGGVNPLLVQSVDPEVQSKLKDIYEDE